MALLRMTRQLAGVTAGSIKQTSLSSLLVPRRAISVPAQGTDLKWIHFVAEWGIFALYQVANNIGST